MSYIAKRNALERDVDGDSVECSFSISVDKVWPNISREISGATHVHLKNIEAIVIVDVDLLWYVVFSSVVESTTGFVFSFFLISTSFIFFVFALFLSSWIQKTRMVGARGYESFSAQPVPLVM